MVNRKNTICTIIFLLFIMINERFIYLIDLTNSKWIDALIIFTAFVFMINLKAIIGDKYDFLNLIILFAILNVFSLVLTNIKYGQPIGLAISRYRYILILFAYVPIKFLIKNLGTKKISNMIAFLGTVLSVIYIMQALVYPNIIIFNMNYIERFGLVRFFSGSYFIIISFMLTLSNFIMSKSKKYLVCIIPQICYIIFVSQTRSAILALLGSILLLSLVNIKKITMKKIILGLAVVLISVGIFSSYFSKMIESINANISDINSNQGSIYLRQVAIQYSLLKLKESPMLGIGLYNASYDNSGFITGTDSKYYADDIGIYGFLFQYGYFGVAIYILIFIKILRYIYIVFKKQKMKNYYYILFYIYTLILLPFNCILNIDNALLYFVITISMLENEYGYLNKIDV